MHSPYPDGLTAHIGKHKSELPSPSLCVSLPIVKENARIFHENVKKAGVNFRAHVKTNKSLEIARILFGQSSNRAIVSTMREARGLQPLIAEGVVKDILYGVPIGPSMLPELDELSTTVTTRLLVDNISHIELLSTCSRRPENRQKPWSVFIKLDMGTKRAGLPLGSPKLQQLIHAAESAPNVDIYGFYFYSAKAAQGRSVQDVETILQEHIEGVLSATRLLSDPTQPLVLSVGSSPTARVIRKIKEQVTPNITFEIHAGERSTELKAQGFHINKSTGTVIYNDLQQLATATIDDSCLAMSVITEVCSVYDVRNEALISAGVLALTREPGHFPGIARVRDSAKKGWIVGRQSQKHGILVYEGDQGQRAEHVWKIGDKVELDIQHTCIAGAMYGWHFMTDEAGIVRDIYYPWKWW